MVKIQIILGSTREGRFGETVGAWVKKLTAVYSNAEFEYIDLRDWPLPFFNDPNSPSTGKYSYDYTKKWSEKISQGDGYIVITPEYNHGYPAVLKNALDHLANEWGMKAVGFISYGGSAGGARSVEQLKQVAIELNMMIAHKSLNIVYARRSFNEQGEPIDPALVDRANAVIEATVKLAEQLKPLREK